MNPTMKRRRFLSLALGAGALGAAASVLRSTGLVLVERRARALGSEVSLRVYHEDAARGEEAIRSGFAALDALEDVLSLYRPESDLCRLNRDGFLRSPHPDLVRVVTSALDWARRTGGAFDPTVQPLWQCYERGQADSADAFAEARRRVDWTRVEVGAGGLRLGPGQSLTLNGIAQGFAADRVRAVLLDHGVRIALVNTGEWGSLGRKPGGGVWRVGIQHPRVPEAYVALADLDGRFLATSGDYETRFGADFTRHHIFDPVTGRSPEALASVTVLARTGMEADALSTAVFVLGPERGIERVTSVSGADALLVRKDGGIMVTPNFPRCA